MKTVHAVVYGNYEPDEIASLYSEEEEAQKHATALNERDGSWMWRVIPKRVWDKFEGLS